MESESDWSAERTASYSGTRPHNVNYFNLMQPTQTDVWLQESRIPRTEVYVTREHPHLFSTDKCPLQVLHRLSGVSESASCVGTASGLTRLVLIPRTPSMARIPPGGAKMSIQYWQ